MSELSALGPILQSSLARAPWGWGLLLIVVLALIRVWPVINEQLAKVREKKRGEVRDDMAAWREQMRADMTDLKKRVEDAESEMSAANERSHKLEMRLMTVTNAFQMVAGELRRHDPDNSTLRQAVEMVGLAVTEDFGMNQALLKLATARGVNE